VKTSQRRHALSVLSLCLSWIPSVVYGQALPEPTGSPLGTPVVNAPFSADATTTVRQVLGDGTRIERVGRARYYRDRVGRVRVEQMIMGLETLSPASDGQVRITIYPDPAKGNVFTLDPRARTVTPGPRGGASTAIGGGSSFAVPLGGASFLVFHRGDQQLGRYGLDSDALQEESLGARQIAGVRTTGRRLTTTIPPGRVGNDRPMQIIDERWESDELKILILARHTDPRTGVIEYQLTNIRRAEPPPDLFEVPQDYATDPTTADNPWLKLEFAEPPRGAKLPSGIRQ
jgi:hypothetical protein